MIVAVFVRSHGSQKSLKGRICDKGHGVHGAALVPKQKKVDVRKERHGYR